MMLGSTPYLLVDVEYDFPASILFLSACDLVHLFWGCGLDWVRVRVVSARGQAVMAGP